MEMQGRCIAWQGTVMAWKRDVKLRMAKVMYGTAWKRDVKLRMAKVMYGTVKA